MVAIKEFGFGSGDEGLDGKVRRFKAKEGEKYRASFVWWPGIEDGKPDLDAATPKFVGAKRLYLQGVGFFVDKGPEYQRLAGGTAGKVYAGTIICVWPTDSTGKVDPVRLKSGDFKLYPWVISVDKYRSIEQVHREFPLGKHDLMMTCTDAQFQKLTFSPCRESLLRRLVEDGKADAIIAQTRELVSIMGTEVAQDLTIDQIREKLARAGGGASPLGGGSAPAGAPGAPVASSDFDSMLNDLG